jgi:hypothetical protein
MSEPDDDEIPTPEQARALFAEWREDYAARARQSLPSPSEIGGPAAIAAWEEMAANEKPLPSPSEITVDAAKEAAEAMKKVLKGPVVDIEQERSGQLSPSHTPGLPKL